MRPVFTMLVAFLFLAVIQIGCLSVWKIGTVLPSLTAILAVHVGLHSPRRSAPLLAAIIGFLTDLLTTGPPGLFTCVYALAGLWIESIRTEVYRDHPLTLALFCAVLAFVANSLSLLHLKLLGGGVGLSWMGMVWTVLLSTAATGLVGPIVARWLYRWRIGMRAD